MNLSKASYSFNDSKPYIDMNTKKKKKAKNNFLLS